MTPSAQRIQKCIDDTPVNKDSDGKQLFFFVGIYQERWWFPWRFLNLPEGIKKRILYAPKCSACHHFSTLPGGAKFAQAAQATQAMSMMRQSALGPLPGVEKPKDCQQLEVGIVVTKRWMVLGWWLFYLSILCTDNKRQDWRTHPLTMSIFYFHRKCLLIDSSSRRIYLDLVLLFEYANKVYRGERNVAPVAEKKTSLLPRNLQQDLLNGPLTLTV